MIRKMENEKKFISQRHNSDFSGYLSEDELNALIKQVESQEMIHAPVHLKADVIEQIKRERRGAKKRQVFAYRAKVLVAMAAALTLLILMPDGRTESMGYMSIEQQAGESLEKMAIQHQEEMDANWEKYLKERESGGVRGFFISLNEKVTEFGTSLYNSMGGE